ncbi:hypothetical protein P4S73_04770 [Paraglaciecola sp. Hal342]
MTVINDHIPKSKHASFTRAWEEYAASNDNPENQECYGQQPQSAQYNPKRNMLAIDNLLNLLERR